MAPPLPAKPGRDERSRLIAAGGRRRLGDICRNAGSGGAEENVSLTRRGEARLRALNMAAEDKVGPSTHPGTHRPVRREFRSNPPRAPDPRAGRRGATRPSAPDLPARRHLPAQTRTCAGGTGGGPAGHAAGRRGRGGEVRGGPARTGPGGAVVHLRHRPRTARRVARSGSFFYLIGQDNVPALHTWHRAGGTARGRAVRGVPTARADDRRGRPPVRPSWSGGWTSPRPKSESGLRQGVRSGILCPRACARSSPPGNCTDRSPNRRKPAINAEDIARECALAAADKKAEDIVVLDLRGISTFTDYYVICSGGSEPADQGHCGSHSRTACGRTTTHARRRWTGFRLANGSFWTTYRCWCISLRATSAGYYALEDLWGDAPRMEVEEKVAGSR